MDDRLKAGRAHLEGGERALERGDNTQAREHFHAALLQFRGMELRLGEAHALRGLATTELSGGDTDQAEEYVRTAIQTYHDLVTHLAVLDDANMTDSMSTSAREGQAHALVLLGQVLGRSGRSEEASTVLVTARDTFEELGDLPSSANVWAALGRVAVRAGLYAKAKGAYEKALELHNRTENTMGQVGMFLTLAELHRLTGDLEAGEAVLNLALVITETTNDKRLQGRVLRAMGSLFMQMGHADEAQRCFEDTLLLVRDTRDLEVEGYSLLGLGELQSRAGQLGAIDCLVDGARIMGQLNHQHGVAGALFQIAEHGIRSAEPAFALVAAEGARRLWLTSDPVRGVGQALRLIVKSLADLQRFREAHLAAEARAALSGELQPNALAVRDWYRARIPVAWADDVAGASRGDLTERASAEVSQALMPIFDEISLPLTALSSVAGALQVVEALADRLPRPPPDEGDIKVDDASISGVWDLYLMDEQQGTEFATAGGEKPPAEPGFYNDEYLFGDDDTEVE